MGKKLKNMTDTNLLLTITIVVFFAMYIGAIVFQGKGFLKPQTFFNILNANAALIILSCGMSLVMITGGIDKRFTRSFIDREASVADVFFISA